MVHHDLESKKELKDLADQITADVKQKIENFRAERTAQMKKQAEEVSKWLVSLNLYIS